MLTDVKIQYSVFRYNLLPKIFIKTVILDEIFKSTNYLFVKELREKSNAFTLVEIKIKVFIFIPSIISSPDFYSFKTRLIL